MGKDDTLDAVIAENEKFREEMRSLVRSLRQEIATTNELVAESHRKRPAAAAPAAAPASNETAMFIKGQEHAVQLFQGMMSSAMQLVQTMQDAYHRGMDDRAAMEEELASRMETADAGGEDEEDDLGDIGKIVGQAQALGSVLTGKVNGGTNFAGLGEFASALSAAAKGSPAGPGGDAPPRE